MIDRLQKLLPGEIENLVRSGHIESYEKFNKFLSDGKFPLYNLSYQLFLDMVEFYAAPSFYFTNEI